MMTMMMMILTMLMFMTQTALESRENTRAIYVCELQTIEITLRKPAKFIHKESNKLALSRG